MFAIIFKIVYFMFMAVLINCSVKKQLNEMCRDTFDMPILQMILFFLVSICAMEGIFFGLVSVWWAFQLVSQLFA